MRNALLQRGAGGRLGLPFMASVLVLLLFVGLSAEGQDAPPVESDAVAAPSDVSSAPDVVVDGASGEVAAADATATAEVDDADTAGEAAAPVVAEPAQVPTGGHAGAPPVAPTVTETQVIEYLEGLDGPALKTLGGKLKGRWSDDVDAEQSGPPTAAALPPIATGSEPAGDAATSDAGAAAQDDATEAHGEDHGGGHTDPVAPILLWLFVILLAAKVGGDVFERFGQPAVLGELVFGVLVGNVAFFAGQEFITLLREGTTIIDVWDASARGSMSLEDAVASRYTGEEAARMLEILRSSGAASWIGQARVLDIFSRVGVIILLFMVGLESNFSDMMKVGVSSLLVAVVGVIAPFILGYGVSYAFMPEESVYVHLFIGATLCATSVGITARVFKDLNKLQTTEAKIILGAAVIDDVLGLIILAVIVGLISAADAGGAAGGSVGVDAIIITMKALGFLFVAIFFGLRLTPWITRQVAKMRIGGMKLIYALLFAFLLSYLANLIGLAPIVGAFAAGLVLDEVHFEKFGITSTVEHLVEPIAYFLVPVFFVLMGIQVKLEKFADVGILGVAAGLTVAAILGKQVCGLVVREKGISRLSIGLGMIPRGEVGLIFAAIGKTLSIRGEAVVNAATFSAVVIMVIVTTLVTPPFLKVSLSRHEKRRAAG